MASPKSTSQPSIESLAEIEWRSWLAAVTGMLLLYEALTGLAIYLLPFSAFTQFSVLLHTVIGILASIPVGWYLARHWWVRRKGNLSHFQLLGYVAAGLLVVSAISGFVVTWQGLTGPRMEYIWDVVHLVSSIALMVLVIAHLATVIVKKTNSPENTRRYRSARRAFYLRSGLGCLALLALGGVWIGSYHEPETRVSFPAQYNWKFGEDRPFAPSLARVDNSQRTQRTLDDLAALLGADHRAGLSEALQAESSEPVGFLTRIRSYVSQAGVADNSRQRCEEILADAARAVQERRSHRREGTGGFRRLRYQRMPHTDLRRMASQRPSLLVDGRHVPACPNDDGQETSPEHTRYCAGCHDPISLFSGAKNSGNITLSALGADEGISCLVCHCIVQTDVQGNGDYTIDAPQRYVYETHEGKLAKLLSDFLIRTYPTQHITSYSRSLYKTPEFCGACHKQYLDKEVNTDIGKVQGQNQYDSWKNSRWHHPESSGKKHRLPRMPYAAAGKPRSRTR